MIAAGSTDLRGTEAVLAFLASPGFFLVYAIIICLRTFQVRVYVKVCTFIVWCRL